MRAGAGGRCGAPTGRPACPAVLRVCGWFGLPLRCRLAYEAAAPDLGCLAAGGLVAGHGLYFSDLKGYLYLWWWWPAAGFRAFRAPCFFGGVGDGLIFS